MNWPIMYWSTWQIAEKHRSGFWHENNIADLHALWWGRIPQETNIWRILGTVRYMKWVAKDRPALLGHTL